MRYRDPDPDPKVLLVVAGLLVAAVLPLGVPLVLRSGPDAASGPGASSFPGGPVDPGVSLDPGDSTDRTTADRTDDPRSSRGDRQYVEPPPADPASEDPVTRLCPDRSVPESVPARASGRVRDPVGGAVSVAVIDPSGFSVADERIASNVVAERSFSRDRGIDNRGRGQHGTATATLVTRFVPNADLSVANFDTAYDFTRAVEWAVDRDVDLIVAPVSFYAKPNDGTADVSEAVEAAVDSGVPVVVPTGNVAQKHFETTYRGENDRWVTFGDDETRMALGGSHSRIQAWLYWNRSVDEARQDFDVVLYRERGGRARQVAVSEDYPRGPVGTNQVLFETVRTNNLLSATAPNGSYYLRVRGPANGTHRVELVTVYHRLANATPRASIVAPATARGPGVIAVGAAAPASGRPLPMSGRGPTADGRVGVDVLATGTVANLSGMRFTGTSAASAYTGGVVARMLAHDPSLTPAQVERLLERTAYSVEGQVQTASGDGLLDVRAALGCVAPGPNGSTTP